MTTTPDNTATTWRDLADQLTPEQIAQVEDFERAASHWPPAEDGHPRSEGVLNVARKMAELNVAKMVLADVAPPTDAVVVHDWMEWGDGSYQRLFTSWSRKVGGGGSVDVHGFQFNDGRVERLIAYTEGDESLTAEQARQLAATLAEAADVLDGWAR